jgi:hypothetical protein
MRAPQQPLLGSWQRAYFPDTRRLPTVARPVRRSRLPKRKREGGLPVITTRATWQAQLAPRVTRRLPDRRVPFPASLQVGDQEWNTRRWPRTRRRRRTPFGRVSCRRAALIRSAGTASADQVWSRLPYDNCRNGSRNGQPQRLSMRRLRRLPGQTPAAVRNPSRFSPAGSVTMC